MPPGAGKSHRIAAAAPKEQEPGNKGRGRGSTGQGDPRRSSRSPGRSAAAWAAPAEQTQRWEQQREPRPPRPHAVPRSLPPRGPPTPGNKNSYAALAGWREEEGNNSADAPPPELDNAPTAPGRDTEGTAPVLPEASQSRTELASEERVVDAFAASARI